jgi:hypothetical protein
VILTSGVLIPEHFWCAHALCRCGGLNFLPGLSPIIRPLCVLVGRGCSCPHGRRHCCLHRPAAVRAGGTLLPAPRPPALPFGSCAFDRRSPARANMAAAAQRSAGANARAHERASHPIPSPSHGRERQGANRATPSESRIELVGEVIGAVASASVCRRVQDQDCSLLEWSWTATDDGHGPGRGVRVCAQATQQHWTRKRAAFIGEEEL